MYENPTICVQAKDGGQIVRSPSALHLHPMPLGPSQLIDSKVLCCGIENTWIQDVPLASARSYYGPSRGCSCRPSWVESGPCRALSVRNYDHIIYERFIDSFASQQILWECNLLSSSQILFHTANPTPRTPPKKKHDGKIMVKNTWQVADNRGKKIYEI